jgi:hypothetical protein
LTSLRCDRLQATSAIRNTVSILVVELLVHAGHLVFVFEVGHPAQPRIITWAPCASAKSISSAVEPDHPTWRLPRFAPLRASPSRSVHHREHRDFRWIGGDPDNQLINQLGAALG